MYKLLNDADGNLNGIKKIVSETEVWYVPLNPANTDYQAYLAWLEEGNTPEPADEGA